MDCIKIDVTGNIAKVIERPRVITSGTVGLEVEFTFDEEWAGLSKTVVFKACEIERVTVGVESKTVVPWEVLETPGVWLMIGICGANGDGSIVIPTIWTNVRVIQPGTSAEGEPGATPHPKIWDQLIAQIDNLSEEIKKIEDTVSDIREAGDCHLLVVTLEPHEEDPENIFIASHSAEQIAQWVNTGGAVVLVHDCLVYQPYILPYPGDGTDASFILVRWFQEKAVAYGFRITQEYPDIGNVALRISETFNFQV